MLYTGLEPALFFLPMPMLTNPAGQAQLFYHGTRRQFDVFRVNALGMIHFSSARGQAEEFASMVRGEPGNVAPIGPPRIVAAHLHSECPFDPRLIRDVEALMDRLDWNQVVQEAEDFSQSSWTLAQAQRWLREGQWQILELPSVLAHLQTHHDALVMEEMGVRNVAVFQASQVHVVRDPFVPRPSRFRSPG